MCDWYVLDYVFEQIGGHVEHRGMNSKVSTNGRVTFPHFQTKDSDQIT